MLKKALIGLVLSLSISSAATLQDDMHKIANNLGKVQNGFYTNNKQYTQFALEELKNNMKKIFKDDEAIEKLLPDHLKYKASLAINSAEMINKYIDKIDAIFKDKNMRMINRQMKSQKAFLNIQGQCFRCHNLVRDWE